MSRNDALNDSRLGWSLDTVVIKEQSNIMKSHGHPLQSGLAISHQKSIRAHTF